MASFVEDQYKSKINIMESMYRYDIAEAHLKIAQLTESYGEKSSYESIMEGAVTDFFNRIKDGIRTLIRKVVNFFKNLFNKTRSTKQASETFYKKYIKEFKACGVKEIRYTGYEFTGDSLMNLVPLFTDDGDKSDYTSFTVNALEVISRCNIDNPSERSIADLYEISRTYDETDPRAQAPRSAVSVEYEIFGTDNVEIKEHTVYFDKACAYLEELPHIDVSSSDATLKKIKAHQAMCEKLIKEAEVKCSKLPDTGEYHNMYDDKSKTLRQMVMNVVKLAYRQLSELSNHFIKTVSGATKWANIFIKQTQEIILAFIKEGKQNNNS